VERRHSPGEQREGFIELFDGDGTDFCDTDSADPFGVACCDCNTDLRIDIADADCTILIAGTASCPAVCDEGSAADGFPGGGAPSSSWAWAT